MPRPSSKRPACRNNRLLESSRSIGIGAGSCSGAWSVRSLILKDAHMKCLLSALFFTLMAMPCAYGADAANTLTPPKTGHIKVAFVLSEGATMIDFAGPWEVFGNVMLDGHGDDMGASMPFELYTVAPTKAPLHTSGSGRPGMTVTPDYSFADAPTPDIVVVGAQSGGPGL